MTHESGWRLDAVKRPRPDPLLAGQTTSEIKERRRLVCRASGRARCPRPQPCDHSRFSHYPECNCSLPMITQKPQYDHLKITRPATPESSSPVSFSLPPSSLPCRAALHDLFGIALVIQCQQPIEHRTSALVTVKKQTAKCVVGPCVSI